MCLFAGLIASRVGVAGIRLIPHMNVPPHLAKLAQEVPDTREWVEREANVKKNNWEAVTMTVTLQVIICIFPLSTVRV